jgi:hypothetical protein
VSADIVNLDVAIENRIIDLVDLESARQIFALANNPKSRERSDLAVLIAALALHAFRDGHACLDVANIDAWRGEHISDLGWPTDSSHWTHALSSNSDVFGTPDDLQTVPRDPFIVEDGRVYISRVFQEEVDIAKRLLLNNGSTVTVVLGGPGTGKTRWVAERLRSMESSTVPSLARVEQVRMCLKRFIMLHPAPLTNCWGITPRALRNSAMVGMNLCRTSWSLWMRLP